MYEFPTKLEPDADGLLPGGHEIPEGHEYLGSLASQDEMNEYAFSNLLPEHKIHTDSHISASIDRPEQGSHHGRLRIRQISDGALQAHVFRKDDKDTGTTHIVVKTALGQ